MEGSYDYGIFNVVCCGPPTYGSGTYFKFSFSIEGATNVYAEPIYFSNDGYFGSVSGPGNFSWVSWFTDYDQEFIFRITATGACGSATYDVAFRSEDCYGQYQYVVSPNPASDEVVVEAKSENNGGKLSEDSPKKLKLFNVKLYNDKGTVLREAVNNGQSKVILNTQGLTNGTYFLHITEGKKVIKKQIIIRH